MKFILDDSLVDIIQNKFPRSKKKRIIKKWAKDQRNYITVPKKDAFIMNNDTIICHPCVKEALDALKSCGYTQPPMNPDVVLMTPPPVPPYNVIPTNFNLTINGMAPLLCISGE